MTDLALSVTRARVGRKLLWPDVMQAKFASSTFDRIAAVLDDGEDRTDFVREAVERELRRRERIKAPSTRSRP